MTHKHKTIQCISAREGFLIAREAAKVSDPLLVILNELQDKDNLLGELHFFAPNIPVYDFPDWETLAYDPFSPHIDIISERLRLLNLLPKLKTGIILVGARTLLNPLAPMAFITSHTFRIKTGEPFDLHQERKNLVNAGYREVDQVFAHGEYATRGSIFDIFPMGSKRPYRLDLFGHEIESIRDFDIESQRSHAKFDSIELLPAHEFPFDDIAIESFIERFKTHFKTLPASFTSLKKGIPIQGLEYYLPLFFEQTATLFDYCPPATTLITRDGLPKTWQEAQSEITSRFEEKRYDQERPPLPPEHLFHRSETLFLQMKNFARVTFTRQVVKAGADRSTDSALALPAFEALKPELAKYKVLFCAQTLAREQLLGEMLQKLGLEIKAINSYQDFENAKSGLHLAIGALWQGWLDPTLNEVLVPELALLKHAEPIRSQNRRDKSEHERIGFDDFSQLNTGDIVVHREHGVGRYLGLSTIELTGQSPEEFLTLEYLKGDKLYVPVQHLNLISRYSIGELEHVTLNELGTDRWNKTREKAARRITDIAAELLEIYAERIQKPGFAHQLPQAEYDEFAQDFAFIETEDQARAIDEIIRDMQRPNPMDRLLCGDVGFGKTEVAMRAAFIAVQNGKQVAVLVPTTLLAEQHFESFQNRFARFAVSIAHFSRFTSKKDEAFILDKVAEGKIDILIGTHKLIRGKLAFKDLGLIIIDEEHRFGVKDKERLRSFKTHVDTLAMSATPIPRTLNFSLSMLRDLSIIATPPAKRLSVKTFVREQNTALIKEAILREVLRGGQVYYLHNDVATIEETREKICHLLPNIQVGVGHGQMNARSLEKVMADFYHNRIQVLVCSTIIETGIDIPNANTIIIEDADRFGLAQLHQLRGRVGRSHHQAYAYLLMPDLKILARDARKRLEAIEKSTELGAGFTLASHDLEIRGAGEVLGEGQSGHMQEIGFSLYQDLLTQAINQHKKGERPNYQSLLINETHDVELNIPRLFPESYISEVHTRLKLYQRLYKIKSLDELLDFKLELIDRFGLLPEAAMNLLECERLKHLAISLGMIKIDGNGAQIKFSLKQPPAFDPLKLIRLVQTHAKELRLRGEQELILKRDMKTASERIKAVDWLLQALVS